MLQYITRVQTRKGVFHVLNNSNFLNNMDAGVAVNTSTTLSRKPLAAHTGTLVVVGLAEDASLSMTRATTTMHALDMFFDSKKLLVSPP